MSFEFIKSVDSSLGIQTLFVTAGALRVQELERISLAYATGDQAFVENCVS